MTSMTRSSVLRSKHQNRGTTETNSLIAFDDWLAVMVSRKFLLQDIHQAAKDGSIVLSLRRREYDKG